MGAAQGKEKVSDSSNEWLLKINARIASIDAVEEYSRMKGEEKEYREYRDALQAVSDELSKSVASKDYYKAYERGTLKSAKTKLAWFLLSGYGGAEDDADSAVALLEGQVKRGDPEAMWLLGVCCEFGIGTEQNLVRAYSLFAQSRERNSFIGGVLVENGEIRERGKGCLFVPCL